MSKLHERLAVYPAQALGGIRRGIEKEGLRVLPHDGLALTPHPLALGSALTHPLIAWQNRPTYQQANEIQTRVPR